METFYKANDGTLFKDKDKCLRYERMQKYTNNASFLFGDIDGNYIPLENILTDDQGSLERVFFIICESYEGYEQLCDLYDELGCIWPEAWEDINDKTPRRWFWNDDSGCWESLDSVLERTKRLKNIFENLAEKG